jgi:hypothetical protein
MQRSPSVVAAYAHDQGTMVKFWSSRLGAFPRASPDSAPRWLRAIGAELQPRGAKGFAPRLPLAREACPPTRPAATGRPQDCNNLAKFFGLSGPNDPFQHIQLKRPPEANTSPNVELKRNRKHCLVRSRARPSAI